MYYIYTINDTVRLPPSKFSQDINASLREVAREQYEGLVDEDIGIVISVTNATKTGEGKVIPGDGAAYYDTDLDMLVYKPLIHEVVEGSITEVTEFGAFIKTGPIEGLIHVSQIMDDYINHDPALPGFVGKESNKKLTKSDAVLARIVTVSIKGNIPDSKIGLTMRQFGLGKEDWLKADEKRKEKKAAAKTASAKDKKGEKK